MNRARFEELAQAYGGDLARWPAALREEAALFVASEPEEARRLLAAEAWLDAALDALPRSAASAQLFETIVGTAPARRPRKGWSGWLAPIGAALAATAAAGIIVGAQLGLDSARRAEASAQSIADLDVSAVWEVG